MKDNFFSILIRGILYFFVFILIAVILLLSVFLATNILTKSNNKPLVSIFTIVSPSMEPTIKIYDCIIVTRVNDDSELEENDIITFYSDYVDSDGYTITHRIKSKYVEDGETRYITKGDNNLTEDEGYVTLDNIVGKTISIIPKIGKFEFFFTSIYGWMIVVCIPLVGFIIFHLFRIIRILRKNRK